MEYPIGTHVISTESNTPGLKGVVLQLVEGNISLYLLGTEDSRAWNSHGTVSVNPFLSRTSGFSRGWHSTPERTTKDYDYYLSGVSGSRIKALGYTKKQLRELLNSSDLETQKFVQEIIEQQLLKK